MKSLQEKGSNFKQNDLVQALIIKVERVASIVFQRFKCFWRMKKAVIWFLPLKFVSPAQFYILT